MAVDFTQRLGSRAWRTGTALATMLGLVGIATPALADFPGERWSVDQITVEGTPTGDLVSPVRLGLQAANNTYFYGDRSVRMAATVTQSDGAAGGSFDLTISDFSTGKTLAQRTGLAFSGGADAVKRAALQWMDTLDCAENCAIAVIRSADPVVQVAEEQAQPDPATEVAAAPADPVTVQDPLPVEVPAPATESPVTETPTQNEPSLAAVTPSVSAEEPVAQSAPDLAEPEIQAAPEDPSDQAPASTVNTGGFEAALLRGFGLLDPSPASTVPAAPAASVDAAPASTPNADKAPDAPRIAPAAQEPARAEATTLTSAATDEAVQAPDAQTWDTAPNVPAAPAADDVDTPQAPATAQGAITDSAVASVAAPETALQDVLPGIRLPEPRPGSVEALAPIASTETPVTGTTSDSQPEAPLELALNEPNFSAPAARPTNTVSGSEAPAIGAESARITTPKPRAEAPVISAAPSAPAAAATDRQASVVATKPETEPSAPTQTETTPQAVEPAAPTTDQAATPTQTEPQVATAPVEPADIRPAQTELPATSETSLPVTQPVNPATNLQEQTEPDTAGEQLALAAPATDPVPAPSNDVVLIPPSPEPEIPETLTPAAPDAAATETPATETTPKVETRIASIDPNAAGPTLANSQWVGFTPAMFTGGDPRPGAWISGPFDRKERTGWITDIATGATTRVTFIWRDGGSGGRTALMSREAAKALGLGQGDVANIAVYLPR